MYLYLTGADTSLSKSTTAPQNDTAKSLGGYVSSTPVPNSELNALFDLISSYTLEKRPQETIAIALVNQLTQAVTNVSLKIVVGQENFATFKVAAVELDDNLAMEHIANRYSEPLAAEFYKADFQRAWVDITITNPASIGEEIALYPFNISLEVEEGGYEGTWAAFEDAFEDNETYMVERISEKVFRISRRDETILSTPLTCSYITTAGFSATFSGQFQNGSTNSVTLISSTSQLAAGKGIGLWLQRSLNKYHYPTNEQLVQEFKDKVEKATTETAEIVITYDLVPVAQNYDDNYNQEDYS